MLMDKMFGDMLKGMIPPEVLELLTKEKIEELGEKVNAFIAHINGNFQMINAKLDMLALNVEAMNVGRNDSAAGSGDAS